MHYEYQIIQNSDKTQFERDVANALNEEWELVGNLKIIRDGGFGILYYREMQRYVVED